MDLYNHYSKIKKQHPDALVFYRVGDFYELFGQDAIEASEILDLTLTSRDCGLAERVPMCGVPYHNADCYLDKLIKAGRKAAICESAGECKPAQKTTNKLNLTAVGTEQTIIKDYLENNVSEVLADKINNGVSIEKDGKTLINKKTLATFMKFACDEAKKQAEKGANAACVISDTVFSWAIHYFEEDSIEGTLYNEDGTEYKPPKTVVNCKPAATVSVPYSKPKPQMSLFDMLEAKPIEVETQTNDSDEFEETETGDELELELETEACKQDELPEETGEPEIPESLQQIGEDKYVDGDGVIYEKPEPAKTVIPDALQKLFGNALIVR